MARGDTHDTVCRRAGSRRPRSGRWPFRRVHHHGRDRPNRPPCQAFRAKTSQVGYVVRARRESDMSTDTSIDARTPAEATVLPAVEEHRGLESTLDLLARMDLATAPEGDVVRALELMVTHAEFPCLGAKSVFRRGGMAHVVLDDMNDPDVADDLLQRLRAFASDIE